MGPLRSNRSRGERSSSCTHDIRYFEGGESFPCTVFRSASCSRQSVKHAKASQAVVTLRLGDTVRLTIADNGIGFAPSTVTADHLGLKIMRERAHSLGGDVSVVHRPGGGTRPTTTGSRRPGGFAAGIVRRSASV